MSMSLRFDKNTLKQAYEEELSYFRIGPNAPNRIKQLLDQVSEIIGEGQNQLTQKQLSSVINQTNMLTTADIVAYCLQSYYDQDQIDESLYSSGIERTTAYFNDTPCEPAHIEEEDKVDYIETVLFRCFSNYMIKKGYRAKDIYRYMIRFGCIFNPRSNIIVQLFNNLSNRYYLRSANLEEGSEYGYTDRNMFTGERKLVNVSSRMYSQITTSSFQNVSGQPFMLTIDYGNITTLDARPYAYVLQALFYMRDNRVSNYEGTKMRLMQEDIQRRQRQQQEIQQQRQQKQQELDRWLEARTQGFLQAGGNGGGNIKRRKSRKNVNINMKNKNKNKSRYRRRGQKKSRVTRSQSMRN
jgi:hypothetical protein